MELYFHSPHVFMACTRILFVGNTNGFDYHFVRLLRIDCILVGQADDGRRSDRNLLVNSNSFISIQP